MKIVPFLILMMITQRSGGQTETFDIMTYTPPKDQAGTGWKKDAGQGVVNYSNVNSTTGGFCVITLYASTVSTGDVENDFKKDWNALAITPFKAGADPKTEKQTTGDGWKIISGAAPIQFDGNAMYVLLTVISGFGKTMSIRTTLNDPSYTGQVDALFASIKLDKSKTSPMTNNNAATTPAGKSTGKFGLLNYTVPAGWSEQIFSDGVVLKPLDLPAGEYLGMQIMQPLHFTGNIEQAFRQSYDEAAAMYKSTKMHYAGGAEYEKKDARISFKGWEYIHGSGGIKIENGTPYPDEYGLDLFVVKVNNRYERIAILKSRKNCKGSVSRYYPDERPAYYNAIDNFLFSLQFNDLETPVVQPATIKGDGIVGVWEGISMAAGAPSTSDPLGLRYKVFTPVFFSNGQAYFGTRFPLEGLDELNTWIQAEKSRRDWGTYTFKNGRGILKLPYGDLPVRMENNRPDSYRVIITVNNTDHAFHKIKPVDGARFSGTYVMNEAYGKIPVISFTADGRFTDNGAIKALYHQPDDCTNPGLAPGTGTYEVKNHSVLFNFSDGRKIKVAFLGAGYDIKNQSPATLTMGFNEDTMTKQ